MAETLTLEVISPHGIVFTGQVRHVCAPGVEGSFGVLPNHTPFLSPLTVGEIVADVDSGTKHFATSGGLAEVHGDKVVILAETAEAISEIDMERADAAADRAQGRIDEGAAELDVDRARAALLRALNRQMLGGGGL